MLENIREKLRSRLTSGRDEILDSGSINFLSENKESFKEGPEKIPEVVLNFYSHPIPRPVRAGM